MESAVALAQMSRTVLAVNELKKKNLPYIVVMCNPTAGGVTGSFASLGDVLIAEPKAIVAFAGRRVIESTVKEELPEDFQTAEFVKEHGGIDLVVERKYSHPLLKKVIKVKKKYNAHDENNKFKTGDKVSIIESKPFSKNKRFQVMENNK